MSSERLYPQLWLKKETTVHRILFLLRVERVIKSIIFFPLWIFLSGIYIIVTHLGFQIIMWREKKEITIDFNILLPLYLGLIVEDMKGRLNPAHVPFGETRELYGVDRVPFFFLQSSFAGGGTTEAPRKQWRRSESHGILYSLHSVTHFFVTVGLSVADRSLVVGRNEGSCQTKNL